MSARARLVNARPAVSAERKRLLGRLHQLKKQLRLDDDTYRDKLHAMTGARSAADLADGLILETLHRWSQELPAADRAPFASGRRASSKLREPFQRLIKALWINLYNLGALEDGSDKALDAFVARQAKIDALAFLRADQAPAIIEALKDWLRREGLDFGDEINGSAARVSVVICQWNTLYKLRAVQLAFRSALESWATGFLKIGARLLGQLSNDQLDAVARELGRMDPARKGEDAMNATDLLSLRPYGGFGVVLADPPWAFENYSALGEDKNAKRHYPCMPTPEICAMPVAAIAGADAALFLWATFPMLPDAMRVVQAWGFTYRTAAPWAKRSRKGHGWAFGPGYWWRGASELLIFATTGKPKRADSRAARSIRNLIVAPLREHSRKPEDAHKTAETWFPEARKIELFARAPRDGWTVWGNQTDKFEAAQ